jgi:Flp pilus assembly CpaE family ATPase
LRPDYGSFAAHFRKLSGGNLGELYKLPVGDWNEQEIEKRLINSQLGFYLLFGPQTVADFHDVSLPQGEKLVNLLSGMADFAVVDLPAHSGPAQEGVIRRSNAVVLVSERDDASLMAAKMAALRMAKWGVSGDAISLVIVNKSPMAEAMPPEKIEDMIGIRLLGVVPPAPDLCAGAQKTSAPLVLYRPRSAPAGILTSIAQRAGAIAAGSSLADH